MSGNVCRSIVLFQLNYTAEVAQKILIVNVLAINTIPMLKHSIYINEKLLDLMI